MRILMLGNSFTYFHGMPRLLAALTGAEVASHTRGGANLGEQYNPETEMGARTLRALAEEKWDYVVLQEQSAGPFANAKAFREHVTELCRLIRANGAVPVLYLTWAYREGSEKLAKTGLSYAEMKQALSDAYHAAAAENGALIADVGDAFFRVTAEMKAYDPDGTKSDTVDLYVPDDYHPSAAGSILAASVIAKTIENHRAGLGK